MNEGERLPMDSEVDSPVDDGQPQVTAGQLLRQMREAAGQSQAGLAASLKVQPAKLQALESDDHAAFSDHVFMRALALGVCRSLRADAKPVLDLLPQGMPKGLSPGQAGINKPIKERSFKGVGAPVSTERNTSKVVFVVLLLLAAAAGVYFFPSDLGQDKELQNEAAAQVEGSAPVAAAGDAQSDAQSSSAPPEPTAVQQAAQAGAGVQPVTEPVPAGSATNPGADAGSSVSASAAAMASSLQSAPSPAAAQAVPQAADKAATGDELLLIRASAESWVQVKNGHGQVVEQKTLAVGESLTASGVLPLSVVIGNAGAVQVSVRGQAMDLAAIARSNVARFEVR
ncbi:helix-turn-helix domain-containing protein [Comamonas composti]|uniref:helix-turn-helix domain-containing protein n=1 Tax=Comamonas composti TaxID=408558 RepID=UPI0006857213|nr:helix-turn-helix domain-containing protein [Comamonas composti]